MMSDCSSFIDIIHQKIADNFNFKKQIHFNCLCEKGERGYQEMYAENVSTPQAVIFYSHID